MNITVDQFQMWKEDQVTKAFMEAAQQRIDDAKEILANQAGQDSISDSMYRGFILAYTEMQEFRVEFEDQ